MMFTIHFFTPVCFLSLRHTGEKYISRKLNDINEKKISLGSIKCSFIQKVKMIIRRDIQILDIRKS